MLDIAECLNEVRNQREPIELIRSTVIRPVSFEKNEFG